MDEPVTRRSALKLIGFSMASLYLPGCATFKSPTAGREVNRMITAAGPQLRLTNGRDFSPIDRTLVGNTLQRAADGTTPVFTGDGDPKRSHDIIRDDTLNNLRANLPKPDEQVPLVIIGGGMSGLMSAYQLKDAVRPVILERADRFGGNSRGESWRGADYSIGAAYFISQKDGTDDQSKTLQALYDDLELGPSTPARQSDLIKVKDTDDPVGLNDSQGHIQRFNSFWDGDTDPNRRTQFKILQQYFQDTLNSANGLFFPDIPIIDPAKEAGTFALDRQNFKDHLEGILADKLVNDPKLKDPAELALFNKDGIHPHILTAMEHYCWSSFGAPFHEIGAAQGLNFFALEFGSINICPGGNAAVAERVCFKLIEKLKLKPKDIDHVFRPGSVVFDVRVDDSGVNVSYQDPSGKVKTIRAKVCIMACPKYVVANILTGIEPKRFALIKESLKYYSYLVANLLVSKPVDPDFYDLFLLGNGDLSTKKLSRMERLVDEQIVTDVVLGTFAKATTPNDRSVLTLYRGLPYSHARKEIIADDAFDRFEKTFKTQIRDQILPHLKLEESDIVDFRMARWGHPLPVAISGQIADGTLAAIRAPFGKRVFFIEQDNWMLPAFETATVEAINVCKTIRPLLT